MVKFSKLPVEIQERMLDLQVGQGNDRNPEVFEYYLCAVDASGGFDWGKTTEGRVFWLKILSDGNIDLFFSLYSKEDQEITNPIYRIGDVVYIQTRRGIIDDLLVSDDSDYKIHVKYDDGNVDFFTVDGKCFQKDHLPMLSFTPWTPEKGGFSNIRPLPDIEVDTVVYVRDACNPEWKIRYFSHFTTKGKCGCFAGQKTSKETKAVTAFAKYSLTNPLITKKQ